LLKVVLNIKNQINHLYKVQISTNYKKAPWPFCYSCYIV
jgi:hypothetical protein